MEIQDFITAEEMRNNSTFINLFNVIKSHLS